MNDGEFASREADIARIGSLVLVGQGRFEHVYAGAGHTLCGRVVDESRAAEDGSFYPCLSCDKSVKAGGARAARIRALRALRAEAASEARVS